ncbi:hypothetical protein J4209_06510 [Candidatus Woesearchaeota archaeon]|nr:hypothetical protein [Candidatus Woesearchaeota archaeon]
MNSDNKDTTIKVKRETKEHLANLDFVKKEHTYNDIILELMMFYINKKNGNK